MLMTTLTPELSKLEELSALPPALALKKVIPVLECLVEDPAFRSSEILPLLEQADRAKEWYVAGTHTGDNRFFSVQIFVWPPGSETKVHDHASWGALRCVVGSIVERALRAPRLRPPAEPRPPEEGLAEGVEQAGQSIDRPALRGRDPPGREPRPRYSRLRSSLRATCGGARRPGLRPLTRLRLRPGGGVRLQLAAHTTTRRAEP